MRAQSERLIDRVTFGDRAEIQAHVGNQQLSGAKPSTPA